MSTVSPVPVPPLVGKLTPGVYPEVPGLVKVKLIISSFINKGV